MLRKRYTNCVRMRSDYGKWPYVDHLVLRGHPHLSGVDLRTHIPENHMLIISNLAYIIRTAAHEIAWKILIACIELMKNRCWMLEGLTKASSFQKQDSQMLSLSANVTCNIDVTATL